MAARGYLGAGDLYIDRIVNGVRQGMTGPFECRKFEVKPNSELKDLVSKGKSTYGQIIETVAIPQPFELSVELGEVNKEGLVLALMGTAEAVTQASGTVSNEAITAKLGIFVPLSKARVSSVVVTNSAGTTTYVEGDDYVVNTELGMVKALAGGAITADQTLHVDFAHAAITGTAIKGATASSVRARLVLDGKNFADDAPTRVTIYEAVITPDSAFDFLADDFNTIMLPGRMKTPAGFVEPFKVELL